MAEPYNYAFTIDRSKWACGGRSTWLVNDDGTMCCLGILAVDCGIECGYAFNPCGLSQENVVKYPLGVTDVADVLIALNDRSELTPAEREARLTEAFAEVGIKVTFKGKLHPDSNVG